ncbi:MAG TPA: acyltransferase [Spirochaetes bacterium]|nr:acyltransferase [Spirochaetota bacterium]
MKIALAQTRPVFGDTNANLEKAVAFVRKTDADLIVFPELFLSGYTFASPGEAAACSFSPDDGTIDTLLEAGREKNIGICGGYAERDGKLLYNSSFFLADGKVLANYRKVHLFYHEKEFFTPGDRGFGVFDFRGVAMGMMICFDWVFPEAARSLALKGAQVVLHPSNLVLPYCQRAMYARALENRVFIVTVNRVGREVNGLFDNTFTGGSQLVSPRGEYLVEMNATEEYAETAAIAPALALDKNITPMNHLFKDRREEFYS